MSILFADLVGSTGLHERLDPESARRFMESYYAAAREAVESHGGTVTQFLGDGVKAVFGIPRVAEDDAIRAVRAGVAMQDAFRALAEQQRGAVGETGLRVAVNTGEVVAKGETEVIGDPVNVAARLQERGRDGDVVIGESTQRLVAAQVSLELLGTFDLKGRAEAVKAYRVLSITAPRRAAATAFVGRVEELARITAVYDLAVRTPATHLAVLLGSPGLGKSRLIGEFARRCGDTATVVAAHCDAAGGATFAPIADALRELLSIETGASADSMRAAVEAALPEEETERKRIAAGISALLTGATGSPEETFFVVRRFLAGLAAPRPVVLAIDDLQWAEPLLIDLVEHLVQWGRGLPLLVLIGARPELREVRSSMAMQGGLVSDVLSLDGLDATAAMRVAAGVIGATDLPAAVAAKVLATSEGNPLFIGELVRMLVDEGALIRDADRWTVGEALATVEMPPTIHALLAARIERLAPAECAALERAAVVGRHFSRSAVAALLPNASAGLDAQLESLQRAELIERDTGWFLGEPVLRFHHVLIRDAAYRRLLKGTRAELHERLANWIEGRVGDAPEHDETIGRHLEEAHRLLGELGPLDEAGQFLGERAATRLAAAGRRALEGDDVPLAAGLLGRALDRMAADDVGRPGQPPEALARRAGLALDWCEALLAAGDVANAGVAIEELGRMTADSERLRAWHTCFVGHHTVLTAPKELSATVELVAAAASTLASLDDAAGEAKGHFVHALALSRLGQVGACEASLDRALAAARRAGDRRRANTVLAIAPLAALWGPSPVTRASGRCLDVVRVLRITQGAPAVEAVALSCQGVLEALRGRTEAAHRMIASGREMVEELGIAQRLFEADVFAGFVAMLEGDAPTAEQTLRGAYGGLRELGLGIDAARAAAMLARAVLAQDRIDEAETLSHESEALAGDDLKAAIAWRGVRAEVLARRGQLEEGVELARAGAAIAASTDALLDHADARRSLAAVLRAAGESVEADEEDRRARELWEAKGATVLAEQPRGSGGVDAQAVASLPQRGGGWRGSAARVRPNRASRVVGQLVDALDDGDFDAARGLYGDSYTEVYHPTGAVLDAADSVGGVELLRRSRDAFFEASAVATLGDSLVLVQRRSGASGAGGQRYDIGPYENDGLHLFEVGGDGRLHRAEEFASDHLIDAVARLYEWYAEAMPSGPDAANALQTARAVRAWHSWTAMDELGFDAIHPAIEMIDHRRLGTWQASGLPAVLEQIESLRQVVTDFELRDEEVLVLTPTALLRRQVNAGVERTGGGVYEREYLVIHGFADDGRMNLQECFDVGDEERALARFDDLVGERDRDVPKASAIPGKLQSAQVVQRRVRRNAATVLMERLEAAFQVRDLETIGALHNGEMEIIDHPNASTYGIEGTIETFERMLRSPRIEFRFEALATLGESLYLGRRRVAGQGTAGGRFDVAEYEMDHIVLSETDDQGRLRLSEVFAADHLGDAIHRLYERYAELMADGPSGERAATAARVIGMSWRLFDFDPDESLVAPDYETVDHRNLGSWNAVGAEEATRHLAALRDVASETVVRTEDILALEPTAWLDRRLHSGMERAGGGIYERQYYILGALAPDGRLRRVELFDIGDGARALARFDRLTRSPGEASVAGAVPRSPAVRRVRPNAASAAGDRFIEFFAAGDAAAMGTMLGDRLEAIDHRWHATYGRDGVLETWRRMMRPQGADYRSELIATLGQSLSLRRSIHAVPAATGGRFDVGEHATDFFTLAQVDGSGQFERLEFFAADHLGEAVARLYELHAELLSEGSQRQRAVTTARAATFMLTLSRDYPVQEVMVPDLEAVDHRIVGHELVGQFSSRWGDSWEELASDLTFRITDVLALSDDALLRSTTAAGFWKLGGGAFETSYYALSIFGPDGRQARVEFFDVGHEMQALARFDELTGATAGLPGQEAGRRRIRANRATATWDRFIAAVDARDVTALAATLSDSFVSPRHSTGTSFGKRGTLDTWSAVFQAEQFEYQVEVLATLGDSHALGIQRISVSGLAGKDFEDFGPAEMDAVFVTEATGAVFELAEEFGADRLGDAIVRLYEVYAENLPEGPERTRAAGIARALPAWNGPMDLSRLEAALYPSMRTIDHRVFGTWSTDSAEEQLRHWRLQLELAPDMAAHHEDVLALSLDALVVQMTFSGTSGDSDRAFENRMCVLFAFGDDGRVKAGEVFESEAEEDALARFDAISGHNDQPVPQPSAARAVADGTAPLRAPSRVWNRADALCDILIEAFHARDWPAFEGMLQEDFRFSDRRPLILLDLDRDGWINMTRRFGDMYSARLSVETIATRGQRLTLRHIRADMAGGDVGPSLVEHLNLFEANEACDRLVWAARFEVTDIAAAYAELDARYEAGEGATPSNNWRSISEFVRSVERRDWDAVRALCRDDFVEQDHRGLAVLGETESADAWVANFRTLVDLAPDTVYRAHHVLEAERGYFVHGSWYGTREGGPYELQVNAVLELDEAGRMRRADIYDDAVADAALARLSELGDTATGTVRESLASRAPSQVVAQSNAASAGVDRWLETYRVGAETGNWDAMREICAPDVEYGDRRRLALLEGGIEMLLASVRERAASGATVDLTRVGTAGDRVEIARVLWSGGPDDGRFEIEYLAVAEVDELGRIGAFVLFDLEDARAAQREAWRRWTAIEPHVAAVVKPIGDLIDAFSEKSAARFRAALADDLVVEDHRLAGMGRIEGADAYTESVAALWAIAPESRLDLGWRWATVDHQGAITVALRTGTVPGGGGDFESECLGLYHVADGRLTRSELFEMDALDEALARFEALRGSPPGPDPLRIPPNQAVRATERLDQAFVARDLPAVRALFHPQFVFEDRGKKALVKGDVETLIESAQYLLALPRVRLDLPLLATIGDRIALQHEVWSGGADRDGFSLERLRYVEVDANGLFRAWILFDSEDRDAAFTEAHKRFVAGEAAGCGTQGLLHNLHVAWGTQDWEALRAAIADDAVVDDYRPLGLGKLGRDGWIESWRFGADMAPDVRLEVLRILVWNEHGRVQLSRVFGTRDGGEFENVLLNLFLWDGELLRYHEFYDVEDAGRAVARFEELCSLKLERQSAR